MKKSRCDDAAVAAESGVDGLGKFGSTEELLSAYNALQSEFTKRCQLVKELQARLDATDAQAEDNAAPRSSAQCGGADGTIAERGAGPYRSSRGRGARGHDGRRGRSGR